ncbi:MAG: D-aminoacyl-tRNA deacylase [Halanaerobiaceae bacterium]
MRAVIQRVKEASVSVDKDIIGAIDSGLLVFLGIGKEDSVDDIKYMVDKIVNLRIFEDEDGKMNLSTLDLKNDILIVSQFTLYGDCRKGRRPGFSSAALPDNAEKLYEEFLNEAEKTGLRIEKGKFQAYMNVELVNDGPVTLLIDSQKIF